MNHESLNITRNNLRKNFKNTTLQQSIDKRYPIQTAHSTVFRFREKLNQKSKSLKSVEHFRNYDFGSFKVKNLELVYNELIKTFKIGYKMTNFRFNPKNLNEFNDWCQKEKHVKKLVDFSI